MMLPAETQERVKRRALSVCRDHFREVLEVARKVPQMISLFIKNDKEKARQMHNEIRMAKEHKVDNVRRLVSQELAEIGAVLLSREDFLRFTNLTSEIADFSEGIAFRIVEIMEYNWLVPINIKNDILKLSEAVLDTVIKLRETLLVLNYGSPQAMEKAKDVEVAEGIVDDLYRELEITLLRSKLEFPALILTRDIIQLLEDSADKAEDAADAARILSFII